MVDFFYYLIKIFWIQRFFFYLFNQQCAHKTHLKCRICTIKYYNLFSRSDFWLIIIFQTYYHSSGSLSFSLRVSPNIRCMPLLRDHSVTLTYVWEPAERGHCANTAWTGRADSIFTWELLYPLLSPDAVICCSYFVNVLLTIIGLKAAKLHIINCNKWKAWGYIYCSTVALLPWNWFRTKNRPSNRGHLWF